jgi:hypothetical protein
MLMMPGFVAWEATAIEYISGVPLSTLENQTTTPSLSDIPKPDPRTSEDCLFLDVIVPGAIYNSSFAQKARVDKDSSWKKEAGGELQIYPSPYRTFHHCNMAIVSITYAISSLASIWPVSTHAVMIDT